MTKFVVRGAAPPEDPPTEFWLEVDVEGDIALRVAKGGSTATVLWLLRSGVIARNSVAPQALRAMGLRINASDEVALDSEGAA